MTLIVNVADTKLMEKNFYFRAARIYLLFINPFNAINDINTVLPK